MSGTDAQPRGRSPQRYLQDDSGGIVQRPRIPDDTWLPALERCHEENRPIGHVLTELLDQWLAGQGGQQEVIERALWAHRYRGEWDQASLPGQIITREAQVVLAALEEKP